MDPNEPTMYYDKEAGAFADTPMFLLTGVSNEIVQAVSGGSPSAAPLPASVSYEMADDLTSNAPLPSSSTAPSPAEQWKRCIARLPRVERQAQVGRRSRHGDHSFFE